VSDAFAGFFGELFQPMAAQSASEDFSDIPNALGAPYTYWGIGESTISFTATQSRPGASAKTSR